MTLLPVRRPLTPASSTPSGSGRDFPILARTVREGVPLVYLDNAATSQRPRQVIQAMTDAYEHHYANVHRGIHTLSEEIDELYEGAREKVRAFINAPRDQSDDDNPATTEEVIFTSGTTHSINLVARSWGDANLRAGDEILADRDGAPLEPRALVSIGRAHRRGGPAHPAYRRRPAPARRPGPALDQADEAGRGGGRVERAWARSIRWRRLSPKPMTPGRWCWWMPPRARPTSRPTCRPWTATSWPSAATRCWVPRASACFTASGSCWRPCRRSWAAGA